MRCALWTVRILVMMGALLTGDLLGLWAKDAEPVAWGPGLCPWLGKSPHPPVSHFPSPHNGVMTLPFLSGCTLRMWWDLIRWPSEEQQACGASVAGRECLSSLRMFLQFGNKWDWQREGAHGAVTLYWTAHWGHLFTSSQTSQSSPTGWHKSLTLPETSTLISLTKSSLLRAEDHRIMNTHETDLTAVTKWRPFLGGGRVTGALDWNVDKNSMCILNKLKKIYNKTLQNEWFQASMYSYRLHII